MGMVVHAPKTKNDRIIDIFLVLDPKTVSRRIWAVSKDMVPGYAGRRCPLTAWGLGLHVPWYGTYSARARGARDPHTPRIAQNRLIRATNG